MWRISEWLRRVLPNDREDPEKRFSKIIIFTFVGVILLMAAAALTSFLVTLEGPEEIMVPEVREKELEEALMDLQERRLYGFVRLRHTSDPTLKGKVVGQEPAAGTLVRAGKEIELVVSRGAVVDRVGDYIGRPIDDVRRELQALFTTFDELLQISDVSYVFNDAPAGTILDQSPESGTELTGPTELDLVVSRGPDVERIELPSYEGLEYEEAIRLLESQDLPFIFTRASEDAEGNPGFVVSQSPPSGTDVARGSKVTLRIIPPEEVGDDRVFGIFERVLPDYPVAVDMTLEAVAPDGTRRTIFSMRHPGGELAVPFVEEIGTTLVLSRFDREVIRFLVRPPERPDDEAGEEDDDSAGATDAEQEDRESDGGETDQERTGE
ncbi:MAG: PASTA domain-containing protein, partial [Spirochaetota bacterium]